MRKMIASVLALSAFTAAMPAFALTASQTVQKQVIVQNDDGTETTRLETAELVVPGETVVYTLNFENDDAAPATDLVLTMPIPPQVRYIDNSAEQAGTVVTYSTDGETFAARDALTVLAADGTSRPASAADVTHVRWLVAGPIAPTETGALSFAGILK